MNNTFVTALLLMMKALTMDQAIEAAISDQKRVGEVVQPPASPDAVQRTRDTLQKSLGAVLPADYETVLKRVDGIDYNGRVIYGTEQSPERRGPGNFWQGVVAANTMWRDESKLDYLVIGETDMDLLTVDLTGRNAVMRDKVSRDINERFDSVGDMIGSVLQR